MLLRHPDLPPVPGLPHLPEDGEEEVLQDALRAPKPEPPAEEGLGPGEVPPEEGLEEAGPQVLGAHLLGQVAADGRFRRGPLLQPALDRLQGLHVFRAVEAMPSRGTPGLGEAVAALPLAEHLGGKAGHGFHLGDGVHPGGGHALRVGQCIGFVKLLYISAECSRGKSPRGRLE